MHSFKSALLASAVLALAAGTAGAADTYPGDKPIKIVAAFSPGSATDTSARIIAEELRKDLGANVIVENKPGAQGLIGTEYAVRQPGDGYTLTIASSSLNSINPGLFKKLPIIAEELRKDLGANVIVENKPGAQGLIGTEYAVRQPGDGYTLTIASSSLNSINPGLFKKLPYDAQKDFTHISRLTTMPMLVLVRGDGDIKTLDQLVQKAKAGSLNYGYGSPGGQVGAVAFNNIAGIRAEGVPYKSQPPALTDLAGGQVDYVLGDLSVATPLLRAGKIRALAVSTEQRLPDLPEVPTFAETDYKAFDLVVWVGLSGPAGIPPEVAQRLNDSVNKALARPEIQEKFKGLGMTTAPNTLAQQQQFVQSQLDTWGRRMREANIQPE
ncbi:tripartite tricarboxylate transporter family receptor [Bordetella bronchiseptica E012]|uniref:Bug family tripartite tricarboxylate transporter substrate binding protein n=1 Tax=Bordetella bronchiseptica TaxID=518 RepID=UPI0004617F7D|nr:tripartite tricarboxylate transporter substrate binding protein [Bordetella bronchiseptica]KDC05229.1 tripartite tricarboxylate transporter family receptor [Bordetella bronchiseptica E012]